jgi:hypothetical protein
MTAESIEGIKAKSLNGANFITQTFTVNDDFCLFLRTMLTLLSEEKRKNQEAQSFFLAVNEILIKIYEERFQNVEHLKGLVAILMGSDTFLPNIEHIQFSCPQDYAESYILREKLNGYTQGLVKISKEEGRRKKIEEESDARERINHLQEVEFTRLNRQLRRGPATKTEASSDEDSQEQQRGQEHSPISSQKPKGKKKKTGTAFDSLTVEEFTQEEKEELKKSKENITKLTRKEILDSFDFIEGKTDDDLIKIASLRTKLKLEPKAFGKLLSLINKIREISNSTSNEKAEVLEAEIEKHLTKFKQNGSAAHYKLNLPENKSISMIFHLDHEKRKFAKQSSALTGAIMFLDKIKNLP